MPECIAAIDQGTTSTRCMIFNHSGEVVGKSQREHRQIYPQPGWIEHNPMEIWECTQDVIQAAALQAGERGYRVIGVGVTNQRETTVIWNRRTGLPYYNAIVWQDTRTKQICDELAQAEGVDRFRKKTGLPLATYFSGPKIRWILENIEEARSGARNGETLFGNIDTWLIWWLTGGVDGGSHVTDATNASRTLLMNLKTLDWDREILDDLGIPIEMLPVIVPSSDPRAWGTTKATGALGEAIPVCGDLGDQQAAFMGQACFSPGNAKNTYGTGCFMLLNTGDEIVESKSGLLTTVAYKIGTQPANYALEGSIAVTGALVQWLRDNLGLITNSADVETLARTVEDNGGMYIVPAFSGLFAPHWRSDARGVIVGLTRFINKGHFARAALEATAYQTREVLDAMQADSRMPLTSLRVDGGMVFNELLMQFQADILDIPVVRPTVTETTALGAAYAAGLAVGYWENLDDLRVNWKVDKVWRPQIDQATREGLYRGWLKAVERTFNWIE